MLGQSIIGHVLSYQKPFISFSTATNEIHQSLVPHLPQSLCLCLMMEHLTQNKKSRDFVSPHDMKTRFECPNWWQAKRSMFQFPLFCPFFFPSSSFRRLKCGHKQKLRLPWKINSFEQKGKKKNEKLKPPAVENLRTKNPSWFQKKIETIAKRQQNSLNGVSVQFLRL